MYTNVKVEKTTEGLKIIHGDHYVANVYGNDAEPLARLFALSPKLLEALEAVLKSDEAVLCMTEATYKKVTKVVMEAKGRL